MDPEALVYMVEDFELDKIDLELWLPILRLTVICRQSTKNGLSDGRDRDSLAEDIARVKVGFVEMRAEKQLTQDSSVSTPPSPTTSAPQSSVAASTPSPSTSRSLSITRTGPPVVVTDARSTSSSAPSSAAPARPSLSSTVPPAHSPPASAPPASPVFGGKKGKGKAKRRRTGSDNEDVDFGGGESGEDAPEEDRECSATPTSATTSQPQLKKHKASPPVTPSTSTEKSQPSPKSSSSKPSVPAPAHHKTGSAPKKVDVTVSDAESMSSPRLIPKRKAAMSPEFRSSFRLAGGSRSDIKSVTSESSPGQSFKSSSSKSKKSCSKKTNTKPKSGRSSSDESVISVSSESESESSSDQASSASEGSEAHEDEESKLSKLRPESQLEASMKPESKAKPAAKADSKSSPKGKKKALLKSTGKKKNSSAQAKKVTASKKQFKSSPKPSRPSKKMKSQDVTDESSLDANLPDWISKYPELVKLAQRASDLLRPYIKYTTVDIETFCKFMAPDHQWRRAINLWPEPARSGYGNEKQAVMSFATYERKHWVSPEAVKRFLSRMASRLLTIKDSEEHRKFKLALERLKKG
ncbi:hypothetical protein PHMEG_00025205 [Phytophthora megakarya]|uniref:Uncharacterized protein n=1 Tax=Phytophthora megakarya TaxID=4795 RepID=A0A225VC85_9STRA|nr:hypothetical protein PHMEG_00025205 [Phytophthora megakarya]